MLAAWENVRGEALSHWQSVDLIAEVVGTWTWPARSGARAAAAVATAKTAEVADNLAGAVGVRDSRDPDGPALTFSPTAWRAFVTRFTHHN
ncbi:protein of unknown function [Micromonospora echinospora]|uniref:DUF397 domain-containing protein n=1 Tax=Micromonospora echinospora TaxID=1877 RepID=A0A1C4Z1N3_MICEC|nr:protein of unknown function [Micromonospora echinospora]